MKRRDLFLVGILPLLACFPGASSGQPPDPDYILSIGGGNASVGFPFTTSTVLDNSAGDDVWGWRLGVCHDPSLLSVEEVSASPELLATLGYVHEDEFWYYQVWLTSDGWVNWVLIYWDPEYLWPGVYALHDVTYGVSGGIGTTTTLEFCDALGGPPPVPTVLVIPGGVGGTEIVPVTIDGVVNIMPPFLRGDANDDAVVDIADAVWILNYLFQGGPAPACMEAADANGEGESVNIADPVYLFYFTSLSGPPPPEPFPDCGGAGDAVICAQYESCP